jgi:hypothetical protein
MHYPIQIRFSASAFPAAEQQQAQATQADKRQRGRFGHRDGCFKTMYLFSGDASFLNRHLTGNNWL